MRFAANVVLLVAAIGVPTAGFAQDGPRKYVIGADLASASFSRSNYESTSPDYPDTYKSTNKNFQVSLTPSVGVFLNDRLVVGADLYLSFDRSNSDVLSNDVKTSSGTGHSLYLSGGPFLRKYFGDPGSHGMPFIHVGGGAGTQVYSSESTPVTGNGYKYSQKGYFDWYFDGRVGYERFINDSIGFEYYGGIAVSGNRYDNVYDYEDDSNDSQAHNTNRYMSGVFGVGLKIYLHRR